MKPNRTYFYYLRDKENRPIVTVCLARFKDVWCRGVALCSSLDAPRASTGRAKALGRAVKACVRKTDCLPIYRLRAFHILDITNSAAFFVEKSCFDISFNDLETKLFEKGLVQAV